MCLKKPLFTTSDTNTANFSFNTISDLIRTTDLSLKSYMLTLGYLTETLFYHEDSSISHNILSYWPLSHFGIVNSQLYSNTMYIIKRTINMLGPEFFQIAVDITKNSPILNNQSQNLTKDEFEERITELMLLSVNNCLNKLENNNNNTVYIDSYKGFKNVNNEDDTGSDMKDIEGSDYNLENFTEKVKDKYFLININGSRASDLGIKIDVDSECENYYYFTLTSFTDITNDIQSFTNYSNSIIKKIRNLIRNKYHTANEFISGILQTSSLGSFITTNFKSFTNFTKFNKILDFSKYLSNEVQEIATKSCEKVKLNLNSLSLWIDSSYLKEVKNFPSYTYNVLLSTAKSANDVIYAQILTPVRNISVYYSEDYVNLFITNIKDLNTKASNVKNFLLDTIESTSLHTYEYIKPLRDVIKIEANEHYLNIMIDKSVIKNYSDGVSGLVHGVMNTCLNSVNNGIEIVNVSKGKVRGIAGSFMSKYLSFLGFGEVRVFSSLEDEKVKEGKTEDVINVSGSCFKHVKSD